MARFFPEAMAQRKMKWIAALSMSMAAFVLTTFIQADESVFELLEKNCIECHNQHDKKGDVAFDRSPLMLDDPSVIIEVVSGENPEMPPKRDPLPAEDVALLREWVESGAEIPAGRILKDTRVSDRDWWSLRPMRASPVPNVESNWCRNEIDCFIEKRLEEKGMSPSDEASPQTLIRRLTFDLTGLPPAPQDIREFLAESASDPDRAYLNLVERLLASPRYGEHWARHWLDVARYGESHGYDKDKARLNAWPYRDYVIRSFNGDKPWTRFVKEQVAGDVLWPDHPDGIVALAFVAAGPWDFIAHTEVGEGKVDGRIAKHLDRDDMVSAVFNVFMSTTVQCAQCHNHKFDPISMDDYYRLHAVFAGVDRADRIYDLDEKVTAKISELEQDILLAEGELKRLEERIREEGGKPLEDLEKKVRKLEKSVSYEKVPEHGYHSAITIDQKEEKWIQFELREISQVEKIRLIGAYDDYAKIGAGFGFPLRFKVQYSTDSSFSAATTIDHTREDFPNPGVQPLGLDGVRAKFIRISATKLAERRNDYIFALGEVEIVSADGENLAATAKVTAKDSIEQGIRWGIKNLVDGKYSKGGNPDTVRALSDARGELDQLLGKLETAEKKKKREDLETKIKQGREALDGLPKGKMVYTLASHFKPRNNFKPTNGKLRTIHLLNRGDITSPESEMAPGAPALWDSVTPIFELDSSHDEGNRRAALANYLTHPENPLLWRSAVNRVWLGHFGRGIVDSPNDFGRMGMLPTHPELLDWLAIRLRNTGSLKELHRLIVTSSTYRQSSANRPGCATLDGSNAYYWRMNRRKLRAEELRDSILSVAGVLDLTMGGPSFQDFKFKDDHTPKYWYHLHDPGDPNTHRRTIYRFIARSQTQPFLTTLDCADPSQMVAKRDETTTALQALALLNNPFMTEMSQKFAERTGGIEDAIWLALGREVKKEEKSLLENYRRKHGMAATARLIFNLNEFAYVD